MAIYHNHLTLIDFDIATLDGAPMLPPVYYNGTATIAGTQQFVLQFYNRYCM